MMKALMIAGGLVFAICTIGFAAAVIGITAIGIAEAKEEFN